ncbi:HPr family phosphocarrier protein [Bacillus horti]|uniref:Phosphocarrier protein HPr n=2 Tax=Caldalkalibacillus horti TaxID=77523 RepID=A0ABT9W507_9BACI|nr:HPr family phosphocarrier protein [Bacillus horti]MDQ0168327.1 phosphotransferase system HPr (HPr) family protein [Bacillus horti]
MVEKEVLITFENGLHARPAAELVKLAKAFHSTIVLDNGKKKVNVKSVLSMMSSSIKQGETVRVKVEGDDEEEAMLSIVNFLKK